MSAFLNDAAVFLQVVAQLGTHILLGTLGGILCEKVGNLNLGIEGIMLLGASSGFFACIATGNPLLAVLVSGLTGVAAALIYAFLTVSLRCNQVVIGLALTIFGTGLSSIIGSSIAGRALPGSVNAILGTKTIPVLSQIPILGKMLFQQSPFVPLAVILSILLYFYFNKTNPGLNARMVGHNPAAADASGIHVSAYKYVHILAGGFLMGIGGGFFSMVYAGRWQNELTAGAGWIAVALVIFSTWDPLKAIFGAYLFGAVRGLTFKLQSGIPIFGQKLVVSSSLLDMLPYLATILVLVLITLRRKPEYKPPKSLGDPYFREDR
ncbi:MAG: ABC transporter permease [Oscillospiraceae bacterium]|nr:ABC transporter permease [Oscillospiraceae bacterium]